MWYVGVGRYPDFMNPHVGGREGCPDSANHQRGGGGVWEIWWQNRASTPQYLLTTITFYIYILNDSGHLNLVDCVQGTVHDNMFNLMFWEYSPPSHTDECPQSWVCIDVVDSSRPLRSLESVDSTFPVVLRDITRVVKAFRLTLVTSGHPSPLRFVRI